MAADAQRRLEQRVVAAAEDVLAKQDSVSVVDLLVALWWLHPAHLDDWRKGRLRYLEPVVQVGPEKLATAMDLFERWAKQRGLQPTDTAPVAGTRERRPLRFGESDSPLVEQMFRTHWLPSGLSERKRERVIEKVSKPPDLVVISPVREFTCHACGTTGDLLIMEDPGPLCLACADLDHLVFLPSGDAALTRRAKAASGLAAVVVRWSRARKRYERRGVLVEERALEQAEAACLADADARARRREREQARRVASDEEFQQSMAAAILRLFPGCPPERAGAIARHTAARGSGRVGRSAAAKDLDAGALTLAVTASVRHEDTRYDELLMSGVAREAARRS